MLYSTIQFVTQTEDAAYTNCSPPPQVAEPPVIVNPSTTTLDTLLKTKTVAGAELPLMVVTLTAAWQKVLHADPRVGFLAQAASLAGKLAAGAVPADKVAATERLIFNARLDAAVTALFAVLVVVIVVEALVEWWRVLSGRKPAQVQEAPHVQTAWAEVA